MPASRALHRDLLGAVGMAVEAGLADQDLQPPPELARHPLDLGAQIVDAARTSPRRRRRTTPVGARYSPKPCAQASPHSPVVTPALAQSIEGSMMLRALCRGAPQTRERRRAPRRGRAPRARPAAGRSGRPRPGVHGEDRAFAGR